MDMDRVDARKEYVRRARASFDDREDDWTHPAPEDEAPALGATLGLRLVLGLFFFLLFVLADVTDHKILDFSTREIATEIASKDSYTNIEKYVMMLLAENE